MTSGRQLRILALLEATSIIGTAKAVLEMAYEARADRTTGGETEVCIANFVRGGQPDNALTKAVREAQIPLSGIRESGRFDTSVIAQIRELVRKYNADVVWSNSVKSHFLVHHSKLKGFCKWVAFHHGYTSTDFKMQMYNQVDRVSLRHADRVVTVCQPFARQMEARGVQSRRIRVQHMSVRRFTTSAQDAAILRNELGVPPDARVILSIGRLSQEKGHVDLIEAFSELEERSKEKLRLVLVGDGPERKRLEAMSRGRGVLFTGFRDDATRFYAMADAFALPSYSEGTPNVILEAMAAGVPVVATRVGGIPELATDGKSALLVPPSDAPAIAKALRGLLGSEELRNELAEGAQEVVSSHTPRAYFENMRRLFLEVAGE